LTYNAAGQPLTFTDAAGNTTSVAYDAKGYHTGTKGPLVASYAFQYDAFGRVTSATDPAGSTVTFSYDAADRV
ncbi:MAG: hypothetical protein JOZ69_16075, partial [Myxococcales bacterium]|nr:hypothetical protein [Myxococcales bacterium]